RCVDPKTQRCDDPLDHVEDRLLPSNKRFATPLDPRTKLLRAYHLHRAGKLRSVRQVAPMALVEELFRQLKLSQMLTRVTVAVEEPEQPRPGSSVCHSTWSHTQGGEILVRDLRTQVPKEPVGGLNPAHEFLEVPQMRRELVR